LVRGANSRRGEKGSNEERRGWGEGMMRAGIVRRWEIWEGMRIG